MASRSEPTVLSVDKRLAIFGAQSTALVDAADVMDRVWAAAARPGAARRHVFDARLAHTLLDHGIKELATRNTRDFEGFGFERVFDPLPGAREGAESEGRSPTVTRLRRTTSGSPIARARRGSACSPPSSRRRRRLRPLPPTR